jgi:hypothetical protein
VRAQAVRAQAVRAQAVVLVLAVGAEAEVRA